MFWLINSLLSYISSNSYLIKYYLKQNPKNSKKKDQVEKVDSKTNSSKVLYNNYLLYEI